MVSMGKKLKPLAKYLSLSGPSCRSPLATSRWQQHITVPIVSRRRHITVSSTPTNLWPNQRKIRRWKVDRCARRMMMSSTKRREPLDDESTTPPIRRQIHQPAGVSTSSSTTGHGAGYTIYDLDLTSSSASSPPPALISSTTIVFFFLLLTPTWKLHVALPGSSPPPTHRSSPGLVTTSVIQSPTAFYPSPTSVQSPSTPGPGHTFPGLPIFFSVDDYDGGEV